MVLPNPAPGRGPINVDAGDDEAAVLPTTGSQTPLPEAAQVSASFVGNKSSKRNSSRTSILVPPPKPTKAISSSTALPSRGMIHAIAAPSVTTTPGKLCAPHSSAKRALPGTRKSRATTNSTSKRSKHPPADNRSTITTTTDTAKQHVNVYDAVLGEAEDLLQAAAQAQALGRLKMASAYQLLLHARLVGLGKRFDRATVVDSSDLTTATILTSHKSPDATTPAIADHCALEISTQTIANTNAPMNGDTRNASATLPSNKSTLENAPAEHTSTTPDPTTPLSKSSNSTVAEFSKYLPSHIELDATMMEHLARVAMQLHHQKTGRKLYSEAHNTALTSTPISNSSSPSQPSTEPSKSTVAWTEQEKQTCHDLLRQGLSEYEISQQLKFRTEAQVRAYVQNSKIRQREARAVEQDFGLDEQVENNQQQQNSTNVATMREVPGRSDTAAVAEAVPGTWDQSSANCHTRSMNLTTTTPRKKGRGRKPPTQAMNTVPNANLDAKVLLSGKALG